jgi:hypothetical protein
VSLCAFFSKAQPDTAAVFYQSNWRFAGVLFVVINSEICGVVLILCLPAVLYLYPLSAQVVPLMLLFVVAAANVTID